MIMKKTLSKSSRKTKKTRKTNSRAVKKKSAFNVFVLLCLVIIPMGFIPLPFGAVENIVIDVLKDAGADSVSVGKAYVTVFKGIHIENLSTYKRKNSRENYRTKVSSVNIIGNVFDLASAISEQKKSSKSKKRDIFMEVFDKPVELAGEAFVQLPAFGLINRIELNGAAIHFTQKNKAGISVEGVSMKLYGNNEFLEGKLFAAKANIPSVTRFDNFNVKLKSDGKRLDIFGVNGKIFDGEFRAQVSINLKNYRILSGSAHISGLDIQQLWTKIKFASGQVGGRVDSDVEIEEGTVTALKSIALKGKFSVSEASAVDLPLQKTDMVKKVSPKLRAIQFEQVNGDFTYSNQKVKFNEIAGTGDVMKFRSIGWLELDNGKWEQNFEGEFSKQFIPQIPSGLIRNSLEKTNDGGGRFKCNINQTFENPRVKVDKSMYRQAIKNTLRRK